MIISPSVSWPDTRIEINSDTSLSRVHNQSAFLRAGDGAYPLSRNLRWHGRLHLRALVKHRVNKRNEAVPVQAIADSQVIYERDSEPGERGASAK